MRIATVVGLSALLLAKVAWAEDFVVDTATTFTNGSAANVIDGSDTLTITRTGSIATGSTSAVLADGSGNAVDNRGRLSTSEDDAIVVLFNDGGNTVTNSGSITSQGQWAIGIQANGGGSTITHSGAIETFGENAAGIEAYDGNNTIVVTSGASIVTNAYNAWGIIAGDGNNHVDLHGAIVTSGDDAKGIELEGGNNVLTVGPGSSIQMLGKRTEGIFVWDENNTVTIAGTVVSLDGSALQFEAHNNTVNLEPGAVLFGGLLFDFPETATLNLAPGYSAYLHFLGMPFTINTDGLPVFIFPGDNLGVVDPTAYAAASNVLLDLTGAVASTLEDRMLSARRATGTRIFALPLGRQPAASSGNGAWASLFGAYRDQDADGLVSAYRNRLGGIVGGFDRQHSERTWLGVHGGYAYDDLRSTGGVSQTRTQAVYGGGYVSHSGDRLFADISTTFGFTTNDNERQVLNNTVPGGIETANGDYDGWFVSPSLTLGPSSPTFGNLSPSLRLRYSAMFLDGYTETGSQANLTVGERTVQIGEIRGQVAYGLPGRTTDRGTVEARLRAGVDGIFNWGDDVDAALFGQTISFAPGGDDAVARGFIGGDVVVASHGGNIDFNAGFEVGYGTDNAFTGEARIGLSGRF